MNQSSCPSVVMGSTAVRWRAAAGRRRYLTRGQGAGLLLHGVRDSRADGVQEERAGRGRGWRSERDAGQHGTRLPAGLRVPVAGTLPQPGLDDHDHGLSKLLR